MLPENSSCREIRILVWRSLVGGGGVLKLEDSIAKGRSAFANGPAKSIISYPHLDLYKVGQQNTDMRIFEHGAG